MPEGEEVQEVEDQTPVDGDEGQETEQQETEPEGTENTEKDGEGEGEEFDANRALAKIRKLNSENRNLRAREKAATAKAAAAEDSEKKVGALEAENLRLRVGTRHGLPEALIDRLQGETEEEILADAEKLLALISPKSGPSNRPKPRLSGGGAPHVEPEELDPRKLAEMIPRR